MADTTPTPEMTTGELKAHYKAAIEYLDRHYAYFLTHVLSIGRPQWTQAVSTAAVGLQHYEESHKKAARQSTDDGIEYDFDFVFNPKFAATLDVPMLAFVLAHETMHIVLNHLKLVDRFIDKDERKRLIEKYKGGDKLTRMELKTLIEQQQAAAKFNIAADAVINDYLEQSGMTIWDNAVRGEDFIGENAAYLTVTEVFERLPDKQKDDGDGDDQCDSCDGSGEKQDDEGNGTGEPCDDCQGSGKGSGQGQPGVGDGRGGQAMDDHGWMLDPDFADKMADAIERAEKELEDQGKLPQDIQDKKEEEATGDTAGSNALQGSMRPGSEEGNIREFQEVNGLAMGWVKLLKEIDPDMFKEPGIAPPPRAAWHRKPRKLGAFRDLNLPVYERDNKREKKTNEKPAIVIALDYSGSIGAGDADRFATLARSIPQERIKLFACTFTTSYKVFDIDNPHGGGGGGTSFDPIVDFINTHVKPELNGKYPKAVVVITDGEAALSKSLWPNEEEAASWLWLMSPDRARGGYGGGYPASLEIGRRAMLSEYTNE